MNIPKLYILLLSLSFICMQLHAQQKTQIELSSHNISKQGDSLHICLMIQAKHVQLASDQSLRIDLNLGNADKHQVLPAIVYTGNKRYKYNYRSKLLSGQLQLAERSVYKTIRGVNKNTTYYVDYDLTIPYEAWMDNASIQQAHFLHDCCTESLLNSLTLIGDIDIKTNPKLLANNEQKELFAAWTPDTSLCARMVSILAAPREAIKERSSVIEVQIDYPKGVYKVVPLYGKNTSKLVDVHTFMESVMNNELITLKHIQIVGYASPEGSYKSNEILATNRSNAFKQYIIGRYKLSNLLIDANSVAEDWDGLVRLLNQKPFAYSQESLELINTYGIFQGREKKLMDLSGGVPYRKMLKELFPQLRRIELKAIYEVANVSANKASEQLYTRPELLSLDEIYSVANTNTQGTQRHQLVYEIAAKIYPNNALANNNAVAACLMNGDTDSALIYLNKLGNNPIGYINRGVYHYMLGDVQQAEHYLQMALQLEDHRKQAQINLALLKNTKHR